MSLEFPGINSLQIQATTEDFLNWVDNWTLGLPLTYLLYLPIKDSGRMLTLPLEPSVLHMDVEN